MQPRKFRFELWPTLVVLALLPGLLALGRWQLERADAKRALLVELSAAAAAAPVPFSAELPRFTRAHAHGAWDPRQFLLDAQTRAGRVGYRVLTPLALADGSFLIVDRGWTAAAPDRAALPAVAIDAATAHVEGLLDGFAQPGVRIGAAAAAGEAWPRVVLYPTAEALSAALGAPVQPVQLRLGPGAAAAAGLELDASVEPMLAAAIGLTPERHFGYAVTWFALAAALVLLWLAFSLRGRDGEGR